MLILTFFTASLCNLGTSSNNRALVLRISAFKATTDALFFSLEADSAFCRSKTQISVNQTNEKKQNLANP